jgi:hypothetical protein
VVSYLRFWFHSHRLRCWDSVEFAVQCSPQNCPVKPPTAKVPCTKSVNECKREAWPRLNTWLRDYKPIQWMLRLTVAPPAVKGRSQWYDFHKKTAELLTPYPAKFWTPVALEATKTSKEVLVRHQAPPGISPFFYQAV